MPAYMQIQTHLPCDEPLLPALLSRCLAVLLELGFPLVPVQSWLSEVTWTVASDGFVYTGSGGEFQEIQVADTQLRVRPHLLGWTQQVLPDLNHSVMAFELLFDAKDLEDPGNDAQYKSGIEGSLWSVMKVVSGHFPESAVFLTDEVQDGEACLGLAKGESARLFWFDLAIIPQPLRPHFETQSDSFVNVTLPDGRTAIADARRWKTLPWRKHFRGENTGQHMPN